MDQIKTTSIIFHLSVKSLTIKFNFTLERSYTKNIFSKQNFHIINLQFSSKLTFASLCFKDEKDKDLSI